MKEKPGSPQTAKFAILSLLPRRKDEIWMLSGEPGRVFVKRALKRKERRMGPGRSVFL
jgi:hypothetical protein